MKKRLFAIILAAILIFAAVPFPAYAFSDIESEDMLNAANTLRMMGVFDGYPDGGFHPGDPLTRAQFTKMAVAVMGQLESAGAYKSFTIFPDVRSSHWAAGFVNFAVRSEAKFIAGNPDGTFKPDSPISFGEAVTILMRMLGYTDAELGFNWPHSYIGRAREIGLLDGLSLTAAQGVDRGSGAVLFYNLLGTDIKGGTTPYIASLAALQTNVTILSVTEKTASGKTNGILYAEGDAVKSAAPVKDMPVSFVGAAGTLAIDSASKNVLTFMPDDTTSIKITASVISYTEIRSVDGEAYKINADTRVISGKEIDDYADVWVDIAPGVNMTLYFNDTDEVVSIYLSSPSAAGEVWVLGSDAEGGLVSLGSLAGVSIYKNGAPAAASDARRYDVAIYDRSAKTLNMTDAKITGVLEDAFPNLATPTKITVMGREFDVLPQATSAAAKFKLGDRITLLLTPDFKAASVLSADILTAEQLGIVREAKMGEVCVVLLNSMVLESGANSDYSKYIGRVVRVSSSTAGQIMIMPVSERAPRGELDLNAMTLDGASVSGNVKIYDTIANNAKTMQVDLKDITTRKIPANKVRHYETDYAGRVSALILNNVTGDLYDYGHMYFYSGNAPEYAPGGTINNPANLLVPAKPAVIRLINGSGDNEYDYSYQKAPLPNNIMAGVAFGPNGEYLDHIEMQRYRNIGRYDFTSDSVVINGISVPLASKVHVYIKTTDRYETLARAREFSESFEVYTDKSIEDGGKVRYIVAL